MSVNRDRERKEREMATKKTEIEEKESVDMKQVWLKQLNPIHSNEIESQPLLCLFNLIEMLSLCCLYNCFVCNFNQNNMQLNKSMKERQAWKVWQQINK